MESYHYTADTRISPSVRVDRPAPRGGHCTGPHLDGCRAHGRARAVALYDRGGALGGPHRMDDGHPVRRLGKYLFRDHRDCRADRTVRFADPADQRRHWPVAIGKHRKPRLRDTAALDRGGADLSHRRRHVPRALGGRTPALAIRAARGDWRRYDRLFGRRRRPAVGAKGGWRSQSGLRLVPFWNRRPRRGDYDGGNDLSRAGAPLCLRGAEPPHLILSAGYGSHLRRHAGPAASWPSSVAAGAGDRLDRPSGRGVMDFAWSTAPGRAARCRPRPILDHQVLNPRRPTVRARP